jgi:tetratricopeptide (TPR) repeat protein
MAADYLLENGRTRIDQLYAISVKVREGVEKEDALYPVLDGILDEPPEHMLADVARWAVWMGRSDWFVERVDWQAFRNNGNEPDLYLRTMIDAGKNRQLLDLSEQLGTQQGSDSPVFLYYRALAWQNLGDDEQAENILRLATQVVEPGEFGVLERYLLQDNRHDLLLQLYRTQLRETPGDPRLLQSLASAYYALGSQDELEALMQEIDIADYAAIPPALSFMLYLKLLLADNPTEYHMDLESFIARYPEVYDFRMVLGVSYLLQNQRELAPEFARQMPPITLSAPRYIRVCAMLLGEEGVFLAPGEIEYLLPRERLLLSLVSRQANH